MWEITPPERAGLPQRLGGFPPTMEAGLKIESGTSKVAMRVAYVSAYRDPPHQMRLPFQLTGLGKLKHALRQPQEHAHSSDLRIEFAPKRALPRRQCNVTEIAL